MFKRKYDKNHKSPHFIRLKGVYFRTTNPLFAYLIVIIIKRSILLYFARLDEFYVDNFQLLKSQNSCIYIQWKLM